MASGLAVYGDFSSIFPSSIKTNYKGDSVEYTIIKGDAIGIQGTTITFPGLKISSIAFRAGVLYKINLKDFDLGLGGGLVYGSSKATYGDKDLKVYQRGISRNLGISIYTTDTYNVAKGLCVSLTVNPDVYLYNYSAEFNNLLGAGTKEKCSFEASGMRFGFAFNASVGVAVMF